MKNLPLILLFVLVLISCTATNLSNTPPNTQTYRMNGQSKHWKLENQQIKITEKEVAYGYGKLSYIGTEKDIEKINYVAVNIYLEDGKKVLSKSISGNVQFHNGYIELDMTKGSPSNLTQSQIENSYAIIRWTINREGDLRERIDLHVDK